MTTPKQFRSFSYVVGVCALSICMICCTSCKNREVARRSYHTSEVKQLESIYHFHVVVVDGCHYLLLEVDRNNPHEGFGFFSHRGNCPNPIHGSDTQRYPPSKEDVLAGIPLKTYEKKNTNP